MSLANNKKSILNKIGAFSSLKEERKPVNSFNSFQSINNKNEIIPYLLDVLKTVAGTEALKQLVGGMFSTFIDSAEPKLKTGLKKQFTQYNSDTQISDTFKTNGVLVPVKNIDSTSKFKVNPDSSNGDLIYNKSIPNFDKTAHNAILNSGTDTSFSVLSLNYNKSSDNFKIKPNLSNLSNPTIGNWFTKYIDDTTIIDKKAIMSSVMDSFYGTITSTENKSIEQVKKELELNRLIENLIAGDDSFELTPKEKEDILKNAEELVNGVVNYDLGCGLMGVSLPMSGLTNLIQTISGSTDSFFIANNIENTITESSKNNQDVTNENLQSIKDNFFQRIIQIFTVKLIQSVTTAPQIQVLLTISNSFQNNGAVITGTAEESLDRYKVIIKCLINDLISIISEFIFNLVVSYLISLLKPIIKKITKEKINQFVSILKSLITKK